MTRNRKENLNPLILARLPLTQYTLFVKRVLETFLPVGGTPYFIHDPVNQYQEAALLYSNFSVSQLLNAQWVPVARFRKEAAARKLMRTI